MYGKRFNENRPFGTVTGDTRFAFDQDGQLFNAMKEPVDSNGVVMPLPPRAIEAENIPVTSTEVIPPNNPDDDIPADERPFDILAWARGDELLKPTPWAKVQAEAAMLLGDTVKLSSKEAARKAILAHYGITS